MRAATHEVANILESNQAYIGTLNGYKNRTLHALRKCRTSALGGHIDTCNNAKCGFLHLSYNSCRNRHCPKCQGHKREAWIRARTLDLLPVAYYHVVFTLPSELNSLALLDPTLVYSSLFKAAWATIQGFGENPKYLGAKTGMISMLHTWGQNLSLHPHLHCIVPGGGITKEGSWKTVKKKNRYLFPVKAMSAVFRAKYVSILRKEGIEDKKLYTTLFSKQWVVYCKRPFKTPNWVIEYLGRYTHKVALSNARIISRQDGEVSFWAKNYKKQGKKEILSLKETEFIRRFGLHILPKGFVRMRHYGFLSSSGKRLYLEKLKEALSAVVETTQVETQHLLCPICKKGKLITVCTFKSRGPPKRWLKKLRKQKEGHVK